MQPKKHCSSSSIVERLQHHPPADDLNKERGWATAESRGTKDINVAGLIGDPVSGWLKAGLAHASSSTTAVGRPSFDHPLCNALPASNWV